MDGLDIAVARANLEQQKAWDGEEGRYWADHADQFDRSVTVYHRRLMRAATIRRGDRVLDIGCGTGQTTRDAARRTGHGHALGLDLSSVMLDVARERALAENLANVAFEQADAQVYPFEPGSFDVALSRCGTMFFADTAAAFANIRTSLIRGGQLVLSVWQPMSQNEWFTAISTALAAGRSLPAPAPDTPNPFSLSDPVHVHALLTETGFTNPSFQSMRAPMHFGADAESAYRFVAGMMDWLVRDLDQQARRAALDSLRRIMGRHATPDGVLFESAMWLVRAERR